MSPSTTHVANASDFPVWAKVTDDGTKVIQSVVITIPGKVEARIETASKFAAEHVFKTGAICEICSAHPLPANYSVIVAKDMTIRATEMGELWKDISGQWH